jgi:hypothetical protein
LNSPDYATLESALRIEGQFGRQVFIEPLVRQLEISLEDVTRARIVDFKRL